MWNVNKMSDDLKKLLDKSNKNKEFSDITKKFDLADLDEVAAPEKLKKV